jgi:hypothetical protein
MPQTSLQQQLTAVSFLLYFFITLVFCQGRTSDSSITPPGLLHNSLNYRVKLCGSNTLFLSFSCIANDAPLNELYFYPKKIHYKKTSVCVFFLQILLNVLFAWLGLNRNESFVFYSHKSWYFFQVYKLMLILSLFLTGIVWLIYWISSSIW